MNDVGAELAEICEAAARLILPLWRSGLAVTRKADESPVTEADQRAEALIRPMASSRISCAVGSSSRSRPETMALAGLMKSWHIRAARWAANSAGRGVSAGELSLMGRPCGDLSLWKTAGHP